MGHLSHRRWWLTRCWWAKLGRRQRPVVRLSFRSDHFLLRQAPRVHDLWCAAPGGRHHLLWFVPGDLSDTWVFLWIAGTFVLFDTAWTLTTVPYYALTAELTDDYDEQASLTAFRVILGVPAYIVGATLTPAIVDLFAKRAG